MRLVVCEWQKLFRLPALWVFVGLCLVLNGLLLGLLLAIALMGLVFYPVRPGFYVERFRGNRAEDAFYLSVDWLEKYGTAMESEERTQLDGQLEALKVEFAQQVAEIPEASEAGITDYESYLAWHGMRVTATGWRGERIPRRSPTSSGPYTTILIPAPSRP